MRWKKYLTKCQPFGRKRIWFIFAVFKKHIGFYPGGEATGVFAEQLEGYQYSKGAIQFPFNQEIDYQLIYEITSWRVNQVEKKVIQ